MGNTLTLPANLTQDQLALMPTFSFNYNHFYCETVKSLNHQYYLASNTKTLSAQVIIEPEEKKVKAKIIKLPDDPNIVSEFIAEMIILLQKEYGGYATLEIPTYLSSEIQTDILLSQVQTEISLSTLQIQKPGTFVVCNKEPSRMLDAIIRLHKTFNSSTNNNNINASTNNNNNGQSIRRPGSPVMFNNSNFSDPNIEDQFERMDLKLP